MQILFPEPVMARLRHQARRVDTSVSDLIRRATEEWLDKSAFLSDEGARPAAADALLFHGGAIRADAAQMKDLVYDRD